MSREGKSEARRQGMGLGLLSPEEPWLPSGNSGPSKGAKGAAGVLQDGGKPEAPSNMSLLVQSQRATAFLAAPFVWLSEY